jgi:isopenicillin N synthase-like dioxygenase
MIPVINWSLFTSGTDRAGIVAALGQAARGPGFFLVENHGVAPALIQSAFAQSAAFFALPKTQKEPLSIYTNPHNRGWAAMGTESLDETSKLVDQKEAFNVGYDMPADDPRVLAGEPFRGVNLWPDLPEFQQVMLDYFATVQALGIDLHRAIALDLGLAEHSFSAHFSEPIATLRLLSYPAASGADAQIGAGAHTDYGSLTLLMTDGVPGLQVKPRGGDWIDVPHIDGAFVVNIGDCLMRWTNDLYVSTPHRVLPPKKSRRSIAFFLDPNPDAIVTALPGTGPAKYGAITGADYLRSRLDATYAPPKKD